MSNFDFTQFISFDSDLPHNEIHKKIEYLFEKAGFSIIAFEELEIVKKEYYFKHWKTFSFELKKDDFLGDFMDWYYKKEVPESVNEFVEIINELLKFNISGLVVIICSFAEKKKTKNEIVNIKHNMLLEELFKMSIHSFKCPDNLVVNIMD